MRLGEVMPALLCATLLSFEKLRCESYYPQKSAMSTHPVLQKSRTEGQNSLLKSLNGTSAGLDKVTQDVIEQPGLGEGPAQFPSSPPLSPYTSCS